METTPSRVLSIADEVQAFEENCVSPVMVEVFQQKTPGERLEIAFRMWTSACELCRAAVSQQHTEWTDERVNREVARRMSHGRV